MCWWPGGGKPVWVGLRVSWGLREAHEKLTLGQEAGPRRSQGRGPETGLGHREKAGMVQRSPSSGWGPGGHLSWGGSGERGGF